MPQPVPRWSGESPRGSGDFGAVADGGGQTLRDFSTPTIHLRITGPPATGTADYPWVQVDESQATLPDLVNCVYPLAGTATSVPARELNKNTSVPAGTKVEGRFTPDGSAVLFGSGPGGRTLVRALSTVTADPTVFGGSCYDAEVVILDTATGSQLIPIPGTPIPVWLTVWNGANGVGAGPAGVAIPPVGLEVYEVDLGPVATVAGQARPRAFAVARQPLLLGTQATLTPAGSPSPTLAVIAGGTGPQVGPGGYHVSAMVEISGAAGGSRWDAYLQFRLVDAGGTGWVPINQTGYYQFGGVGPINVGHVATFSAEVVLSPGPSGAPAGGTIVVCGLGLVDGSDINVVMTAVSLTVTPVRYTFRV